jgi:phage terminase small subunit
MRYRPPSKRGNKLTAKQQAFCSEYLRDLNASAAARRAGYSPRSADRIAMQLMSKSHIRARVEQLQAERNERVKVDADWVLRRLLAELEADARDLYDTEGQLKPVHEWPEIWRKGLVTNIVTTEVYGSPDEKGRPKVVGQMKNVILADRVKRLELIGKHISVAAFREKVSLGVDDPLRVLFDQIKGQSIRPTIEVQAIRTQLPQPESDPHA